MNKLKTILFALFIGAFLISFSVFATDSDFEISPMTGLFNEVNLAPGDQVTKILTLTNNTSYIQEVKFKIINYNDGIPDFLFFKSNPLGEKINIEVEDGSNILYSKNTLNHFKSQEISLNLSPGSKNLNFNAYFDKSADNNYQGSSVSFDFQFNARWEGGGETVDVPGTTSGATGRVAGTITGGTVGAGGTTGGTIGSGAFTALGFPEILSTEDINEEEEPQKKVGEVAGEEDERGFWDKLRSAVSDFLPPFCVDLTSILWLFIGSGVGILGHYLLNKKWGSSAGGGTVTMSFLGLFWSQCSFWWLIIGIIIGFFAREFYKKRKEEKKNPEETTPSPF